MSTSGDRKRFLEQIAKRRLRIQDTDSDSDPEIHFNLPSHRVLRSQHSLENKTFEDIGLPAKKSKKKKGPPVPPPIQNYRPPSPLDYRPPPPPAHETPPPPGFPPLSPLGHKPLTPPVKGYRPPPEDQPVNPENLLPKGLLEDTPITLPAPRYYHLLPDPLEDLEPSEPENWGDNPPHNFGPQTPEYWATPEDYSEPQDRDNLPENWENNSEEFFPENWKERIEPSSPGTPEPEPSEIPAPDSLGPLDLFASLEESSDSDKESSDLDTPSEASDIQPVATMATPNDIRKILSEMFGNIGPTIDNTGAVIQHAGNQTLTDKLTSMKRTQEMTKPPGPDIFKGTTKENARLWKTRMNDYLTHCGYTTNQEKMRVIKMFLAVLDSFEICVWS